MAEAVRAVLAVTPEALSDEDALAQVLDPTRNPYLGHPLFLGMQSKLMQTLSHVPFTWAKRISMAEDAQNQRHRGTAGSRPAPAGMEQPGAGCDRALGYQAEPGRLGRV